MKKQEALIIKAYIKEHFRTFVLYVLIVASFLGVAGLYQYEDVVRNMSYAALLIAFFGILYGIWDYAVYRKKCILLISAMKRRGERALYLPDNKSYADELYRQIIAAMEEEERSFVSEYDEKKRDMADYYTMWIHQIKTPIAALRLLLKEEKQPREELFKIEQYAEMALHYARLDSLSSDLAFRTQDIYEMVKHAVKKYSIFFIGSGLSFQLEECSIHAVTDEKWLTFVIEQILSNAIKYTQEGGIGIRGEDLPRIFERGFTGYNGRLDKKSTGIGLYLCRQILDRLSHTIGVESHIGQGTKVTLGFVQEGNVTKL